MGGSGGRVGGGGPAQANTARRSSVWRPGTLVWQPETLSCPHIDKWAKQKSALLAISASRAEIWRGPKWAHLERHGRHSFLMISTQ